MSDRLVKCDAAQSVRLEEELCQPESVYSFPFG